jgi:hypothetical protein
MEPILAHPRQEKRVHPKTSSSCAHGRMVDEVRSTNGAKTGQLICKECLAEFPIPAIRSPVKRIQISSNSGTGNPSGKGVSPF